MYLRLSLLPLLTLPYWCGLSHHQGNAFLSATSLWPIAFAILALAIFVPLSWWIFELDACDRSSAWSRLVLVSLGSSALFYLAANLGWGIIHSGKHGASDTRLGFYNLGLVDLLDHLPGVPLWVSILAYSLEVGLREEGAKAFVAQAHVLDGVRTRAAFGFLAGVGFGIGEALLYSYRDYAGAADWLTYLTRFVFVIGLHGCMSVIAVLLLPDDWTDRDKIALSLVCLLPAAILHGAYDALVTRGLMAWGGIIATVIIVLVPAVLWWRETLEGEP